MAFGFAILHLFGVKKMGFGAGVGRNGLLGGVGHAHQTGGVGSTFKGVGYYQGHRLAGVVNLVRNHW